MADNSNGRKKALIISVLAFLLAGGGVFLFFVIQGSNDLTGADKSRFSYGTAARGAATSFFKFLGFDSVEAVSKVQERPRIAMAKDAAGASEGAPAAASAAKDDPLSGWGGLKHGGQASPTAVPHMAGAGLPGVGGMGAGGSQSSANVSRFGDGSDSGNVKITGKSLASASSAGAAKGTLGALQNARAELGAGLRSGSAMTAHAKWDSSFGLAGGRGGKELAYGKSGLVGLDKIKTGEVDNLKTTDPKSLKVPDVPGFKQDTNANVELDSDSKKAKTEAEDAIKKSIASNLTSGLGDAITKGNTSNTSNTGNTTPTSGNCDFASGGEQSKTCGTMQQFSFKSDTGGTWEKAGTGPNGEVLYNVSFTGRGPGITDELKGQDVAYTDKGMIMVDPKTGNVVGTKWEKPIEIKYTGTGN